MGPQMCSFCSIVAGAAPATIIGKWPTVWAISPLEPATPGHTLVIPRQHRRYVWDLEVNLAADLMAGVLRVTEAVRSVVNPDGINIVNSNGLAATQTVEHVHFHVLARFDGDHAIVDWPEADNSPDPQTEAVSQELANYLSVNQTQRT